MPTCRFRACFGLLLCFVATDLFAAGGTAVIASKGQPVTAAAGWPEGLGELLNDPARTTGWLDWFSEWPNDVNHYAFENATTDDINRLIEKLAAVKSEVRQIRLSYLREPSGLGWVTQLPKGNGIAAIFSMGDQERIDEWYKRVRKPFGVMEFTAAPVAVPPTLTIFIRNKAVNLDEIKIPEGITVTSGNVPTVFHRFNTKDEQKREAAAAQKDAAKKEATEESDPVARETIERIDAFLAKRNRKAD